uniref:Lipoxygenase n=1 Tax=Populus trichocarpa TaxID=3694 RepID=A0A3N7GU72_POPTR
MGFCPVSEMMQKVMEMFYTQPKTKAEGNEVEGRRKIKGTVVLMKKNVLDFNDIKASFLDRVHELLGKGVSMQLVSAVHQDPDGLRGKLGKVAYLEKWVTTITPLTAGETMFTITFEWDESMGFPGAIIIKNHHHSQLYLKTVTLEDIPGHGRVHFICNSWVYPTHRYKYDRAFFSNKAIKRNRLYILDHHDALMPYLRRINSTSTKTYASRTILFLQDDGTLKPLSIELSLPHPQGDRHGAVSKVFTPAEQGVEGSVWQLAKAYAAVNDSGYHQLVSHWLNTHAVIEPFVIATNRQLSVLHPIYKLLHPHFRDTMNINALARQILINAGGILEITVFPAKYAMEMSSFVYKNWVFTEQALPTDLLKRGVAVPDSSQPHGLRLLIEDYPYAVDGLEIWSAIETWVKEYCAFYYPTDDLIQGDSELQSWWTEICNVGHGDKKDEPWWPEMQTLVDVTQTCTIIIWIASALHAAVNFGQYPYAGYLPNRPSLSRRFMPEPGTPEYAELEKNPDVAYLKTITAQLQTLLGVSLIEILSRHSTDEVYLGQRDTAEWTLDSEPLAAFERFRRKLVEIENKIMDMNNDKRWKNRVGPVEVPYTLLFPNTTDYSREGGLTGRGIPNSISI